jgi:hypothetical protein
MADFELRQEVRVVGYTSLSSEGMPPDGWPGRIVKITAKQVHIEYGDRPLTDIFDRRTQRIRYGDVGRKFRTLPQVADHNRRQAAMRVLGDHKVIRMDPRDFTTGQLEALASAVRTFGEVPPVATYTVDGTIRSLQTDTGHVFNYDVDMPFNVPAASGPAPGGPYDWVQRVLSQHRADRGRRVRLTLEVLDDYAPEEDR